MGGGFSRSSCTVSLSGCLGGCVDVVDPDSPEGPGVKDLPAFPFPRPRPRLIGVLRIGAILCLPEHVDLGTGASSSSSMEWRDSALST